MTKMIRRLTLGAGLGAVLLTASLGAHPGRVAHAAGPRGLGWGVKTTLDCSGAPLGGPEYCVPSGSYIRADVKRLDDFVTGRSAHRLLIKQEVVYSEAGTGSETVYQHESGYVLSGTNRGGRAQKYCYVNGPGVIGDQKVTGNAVKLGDNEWWYMRVSHYSHELDYQMPCLMQPGCTRLKWEWECDWPGAGRVARVVQLTSPGRPTLRSLKHGFYSFDTSPGTNVHFVASDHAYYNADTPVEDYNRLRIPWGEPDRYDIEGTAIKVFDAGGNRWSTCMGTVPGTPCQATPSPTPSPSPTPTPCVVCDPPAHQPVSLGIWPTPLPWTVDVSDIDSIQDDTIRDRFQAAAAASVHLVNVAAEVPIVQLWSDTGQLRLVAHTACEAEDTGFPAFRADGEIADHTYREPEAGSPLCPGPYLDHGAVLYFREKKTAGNPFCHWADQVADMWTQTETTNLVMHELLHAVITVGHPPDHGAAELCTPVQSRMCSRAKAIGPPVLFAVDFAALECLYQGYVP